MSKKEEETIVAIPGEEGWELWQRQSGVFELIDQRELDEEGNYEPFRHATHYGFPLVSAFAIPLWVATDDPALLPNVVDMQLEKLGLKPDSVNGTLMDYKMALKGEPLPALPEEPKKSEPVIEGLEGLDISEDGEPEEPAEPAARNLVLATVLSPNYSHSLPKLGADFFDVSPRFFVLPGNHVTVWKELGRIVIAITRNDQLVYFQALSGDTLDLDAVHEIKCLLMQLFVEGVVTQPAGFVIWTEEVDSGVEAAVKEQLELQPIVEEKPRPVIPAKGSKLVPAEVDLLRQAQARAERRKKIILGVAALYLVGVGFALFNYFMQQREVSNLRAELAALEPQVGWIGPQRAKWRTFEKAFDGNRYPIEVFHRCVSLLPPKGVRFVDFKITDGMVVIDGQASNTTVANQYGGKVFKSDLLKDFNWQWTKRPTVDTRKREKTAAFKIQGKYKWDDEA